MSRLEETESRLRALVDVCRHLVAETTADELLGIVVDAVMRLLGAEGCSIALADEAAGKLVFTTIVGSVKADELRIDLGQGIAGWVVTHGEPVVANDVAKDERFYPGVDRRTGFQTRSILCVPLRHQERTIGALEAINTNAPEGFTDDDAELLTAFAGIAGTAIVRSKAWDRLRNAAVASREIVEDRYALVLGNSEPMRAAEETARAAAASRATVLLLGESGVGKEVFARAIHRWSPRAEGPFVAVNCVALTPQLLESELFGHEKGAFTGAVAQKKGRFELADGGTIFLDEIGDLAPDLQARLLRVLQEREFQRVGGIRDIRTDVRVVAATNRDLREAVRTGKFREDLFYRLNVVTITLPPLRERKADVPALVDHFLERSRRETNRGPLRIDEAAMAALRSYDWPGNVRELQNAIERAVVLSSTDLLGMDDLPDRVRRGAGDTGVGPGAPSADAVDPALPLADALEAFKASRIRSALAAASGSRTKAAKLLGMQPSNLSRLIRTLGLAEDPDSTPRA